MTALLIVVVFAVPAACIAWLLPGLDALGRATAGAAGSFCLLTLLAQGMIVFKVWSPMAGVGTAALVSAVLAFLAWRRRPVHRARVRAAERGDHDDEDWLFAE